MKNYSEKSTLFKEFGHIDKMPHQILKPCP